MHRLCLVLLSFFAFSIQAQTKLLDVPYATNAGVKLTLDLYMPKGLSDAAPTAIYVHGGGWEHGSKRGGGWFEAVRDELVHRGYVVASVEYRLAPEHKWPAFIHDVKAAVRFLRLNAPKYHVDPAHIGAWGSSAGGHLVALLGTADAKAKLEGEHYLGQSSSVQAVVDLFGPSKLDGMKATDTNSGRAARVFSDDPAKVSRILTEASPIKYVSKDDAPFLIIHGEDDELVPLQQGRILHEKLLSVGVPSQFVPVKNGQHGLNGRQIEPGRTELVTMIANFFDKYLKSAKR